MVEKLFGFMFDYFLFFLVCASAGLAYVVSIFGLWGVIALMVAYIFVCGCGMVLSLWQTRYLILHQEEQETRR